MMARARVGGLERRTAESEPLCGSSSNNEPASRRVRALECGHAQARAHALTSPLALVNASRMRARASTPARARAQSEHDLRPARTVACAMRTHAREPSPGPRACTHTYAASAPTSHIYCSLCPSRVALSFYRGGLFCVGAG